MIATFGDRETAKVFIGGRPRGMSAELTSAALKKLRAIDAAATLKDLSVPPGNYLEPLRGSRAGQHSIRINAQWRITFIWRDAAAYDVTIEDYH